MKFSLFIIAFVSICFSCNQAPTNNPTTSKQDSIAVNQKSISENRSKYAVVVFPLDSLNPQKGFGYDILIDGSRFIHQTNIPSIQGNNGFSTKEKAESVANLMIYKLAHNVMPPSVSKNELDSLHILN